jgi:hypothetical protein
MFFDDHAPPHFHAEHQGQEVLELELNWRRAKKLKPLVHIAPLD